MKIGILRETKNPPDKRVALTPSGCKKLKEEFPGLEIVAQPDDYRAFTDEEYKAAGIPLKQDVSDCDVLFGVKEVKTDLLIPEKTYFFFSHTAKKQPYNRELLKEILRRKIRLIDYEYLTSKNNLRLVAFGRWAGIVGAYNGLRGWGLRFKKYELKPAWLCKDKEELFRELKKVEPGNARIVITGGGRVANGAMEVLVSAGFRKVSPEEFLNTNYKEAVFCQLEPWHYVKRLDGQAFELHHFFNFPEEYETTFLPFTSRADIYIACHFWDPRSPVFMTSEDMQNKDFRIKLIADISCDINGPVPSTLRASTINKPFYGYNPATGHEDEPFARENITVMAVDNLPGELPRDASEDFADKLIREVIPCLLDENKGDVIKRATIAEDGKLTSKFNYLEDYVKGIE